MDVMLSWPQFQLTVVQAVFAFEKLNETLFVFLFICIKKYSAICGIYLNAVDLLINENLEKRSRTVICGGERHEKSPPVQFKGFCMLTKFKKNKIKTI